MQTSYGRGHDRGRERKKDGGRRQLMQLLVCLAVFLAVFIGKGVWPSHVARTGAQLLAVIRANTDFRAAFAGLGQALSGQESVLGEIGQFCVEVFAPQAEVREQPAVQTMRPEASISVPEESVMEEEQPLLQVGDVVQEGEGDLPEGYCAHNLYLGELEMMAPVCGTVTSSFGYRDHPTIGRHAVHGGVDIAAEQGTAVCAFAPGVVESVGEDSDFGKYLYLTHGDGVTTFYAHCSAVKVKQGDRVEAGQTVAQVGSTGKSTGPHLHFEVRLNGTRLNPLHYIDPGQEV